MSFAIELPLGGHIAPGESSTVIVDASDEWVARHTWRILRTRSLTYACATIRRKTVLLHRLLLARDCEGKVVDHINGDGLDNRRANIRAVDRRTNCRNCKTYRNNSSGITGVYSKAQGKLWDAQASIASRRFSLGSFTTKEAAAVAVAIAENAHHGIEPRRREELNRWLSLGINPDDFRNQKCRETLAERIDRAIRYAESVEGGAGR